MRDFIKQHLAGLLAIAAILAMGALGSACGEQKSVEHELVYRHMGLLEFCRADQVAKFSKPGSVRLGRGDSYVLMTEICKKEHGLGWVPDDQSVSRKRCDGSAWVYGFRCTPQANNPTPSPTPSPEPSPSPAPSPSPSPRPRRP